MQHLYFGSHRTSEQWLHRQAPFKSSVTTVWWLSFLTFPCCMQKLDCSTMTNCLQPLSLPCPQRCGALAPQAHISWAIGAQIQPYDPGMGKYVKLVPIGHCNVQSFPSMCLQHNITGLHIQCKKGLWVDLTYVCILIQAYLPCKLSVQQVPTCSALMTDSCTLWDGIQNEA